MSLATSNRDGGRTSESGHLRALLKGLKAQVLTGLNVSQRGAGANMSVDIAIGDAMIPRSDGTYGHPAWNDAVYNQVITTADVSNPRRDIVVMYIDYGQTPSTGVSNNTNGVVKIKVVAGTPAGSPVDPSDASIQSSVTAGNPWIKLARVRVAAGAASITNSVIDDLRLLATGIMQGGWIYDDVYTWVYASATTFTVAGVDVRSQFPRGSKIALYQAGSIKYFVVTDTAFSTNTTVTVASAGDITAPYVLANVPIDKPAVSYMATPSNFPGVVKRAPFAIQGDGGTAANTKIEGAPEVSFSGTVADYGRGSIAVPQDYMPGTPARIILHVRTTNAQSRTGTHFIGARGPNGSWSSWNVVTSGANPSYAYALNMSELTLNTTVPAANLAAGGTVVWAFGNFGAITGTIFLVFAELQYTATS